MKFVLAFMVLLGGCQHGDGEAAGSPPPNNAIYTDAAYAKDIGKICDAMKLSGADKDPGGQMVVVANYLAAHLETQASRDFMIRIQPLVGEAKAKAFDDEAHKVGLADCAVASLWRKH